MSSPHITEVTTPAIGNKSTRSNTTTIIQATATTNTTQFVNMTTNDIFKCTTYLCKGIKQSIDYIATLLCSNDSVCLSEIWLRPGELSAIELWLNHNPQLC